MVKQEKVAESDVEIEENEEMDSGEWLLGAPEPGISRAQSAFFGGDTDNETPESSKSKKRRRITFGGKLKPGLGVSPSTAASSKSQSLKRSGAKENLEEADLGSIADQFLSETQILQKWIGKLPLKSAFIASKKIQRTHAGNAVAKVSGANGCGT